MVLEDDKGNIFNVEACLEYEDEARELKLLAKALYSKLKAYEAELDIIYEWSEDLDEVLESYMGVCDE